jgi:hypothetical protein
MSRSTNQQVIEQLREISDLLEQQGANPFRVNAYRRAAETLESQDVDLESFIRDEGVDGLMDLPNIGAGIARSIYEIVATGRSSRLQRLRGSLDPIKLFQTVPGIGPELAERIHDHLQVDTLEALEMAAHDGRLQKVPGMGARRSAAIRASLSTMLGQRIRRHTQDQESGPSVALLLDVDREYREKAKAGKLPTIVPRRFNPEGKAWLSVLHTSRDGWHFTALYSNTARAHELGRTEDWVVIYYYDDHHHEDQYTVVTETRGPLTGKRVIRGRDSDCRQYYSQHAN